MGKNHHKKIKRSSSVDLWSHDPEENTPPVAEINSTIETPPVTAEIDSTEENAPTVAEPDLPVVETRRPPEGTFCSPLIIVRVGSLSKSMTLHSGVLSQSTVLNDRIQETQHQGTKSLVISDVTTPIFDRVLRYLYGSPLENCISKLPSLSQGETQDQDVLRIAGEIHCFSLTYGLEELGDRIASFIQNTSDTTYQSVLETAKHVYKHAPRIEPWFRDFVSQKTQEALADPGVADEAWFVETFEGDYNGLSKELFECYKHIHRVSSRAVSPPVSEVTPPPVRGKRVKSDQVRKVEWNLEEAAPDVEEAITEEPYAACAEEPCQVYAEEAAPTDDYTVGEAVLEDIAPPEVEAPMEDEHPVEEALPAEPDQVYDEAPAPEEESICEPEAFPEEPTSPYEMVVRYELSNSCPLRHHHLRKKLRWERCNDCTQELVKIARSAASTN